MQTEGELRGMGALLGGARGPRGASPQCGTVQGATLSGRKLWVQCSFLIFENKIESASTYFID